MQVPYDRGAGSRFQKRNELVIVIHVKRPRPYIGCLNDLSGGVREKGKEEDVDQMT